MKELNKKCAKINDTVLGLGRYVVDFGHMIHSSSVPMNEIYWSGPFRIADKYISMTNFRYVEYVDLINDNIKPFKKEK